MGACLAAHLPKLGNVWNQPYYALGMIRVFFVVPAPARYITPKHSNKAKRALSYSAASSCILAVNKSSHVVIYIEREYQIRAYNRRGLQQLECTQSKYIYYVRRVHTYIVIFEIVICTI